MVRRAIDAELGSIVTGTGLRQADSFGG